MVSTFLMLNYKRKSIYSPMTHSGTQNSGAWVTKIKVRWHSLTSLTVWFVAKLFGRVKLTVEL